MRRVVPFRNRAARFDHLRNFVRVLDDHFPCNVLAEIGEFLQHFFRGTEIELGFLIGVLESETGQDDAAVNFVFGIFIMRVAGRTDRTLCLPPDFDNPSVEIPESFFVRHLPLADHEFVVGDRLNLKVIVVFRDFDEVGFRLPFHHRGEQFPGFTRGAENQSFAVFVQIGSRNTGIPVIIFQIRIGNQPVEVLHAGLIFHKNDLVVRLELERVGLFRHDVVHAGDGIDPFLLQAFDHAGENRRQHFRVVGGTVMIEVAQLVIFGNRIQFVIFQSRIHVAGHRHGIEVGIFKRQSRFGRRLTDEARIERRVVRDEHPVADESKKVL